MEVLGLPDDGKRITSLGKSEATKVIDELRYAIQCNGFGHIFSLLQILMPSVSFTPTVIRRAYDGYLNAPDVDRPSKYVATFIDLITNDFPLTMIPNMVKDEPVVVQIMSIITKVDKRSAAQTAPDVDSSAYPLLVSSILKRLEGLKDYIKRYDAAVATSMGTQVIGDSVKSIYATYAERSDDDFTKACLDRVILFLHAASVMKMEHPEKRLDELFTLLETVVPE